jgi:hypothetical protein
VKKVIRYTNLQFKSSWLSINLGLGFKGNLFVVACILFIVKIWASWSDRSLIMGYKEDKFILLLSTNRLTMAVLHLFWILIAIFIVCRRLMLLITRLIIFLCCLQWDCVFMFHKTKLLLQVYTMFQSIILILYKLIKISCRRSV